MSTLISIIKEAQNELNNKNIMKILYFTVSTLIVAVIALLAIYCANHQYAFCRLDFGSPMIYTSECELNSLWLWAFLLIAIWVVVLTVITYKYIRECR